MSDYDWSSEPIQPPTFIAQNQDPATIVTSHANAVAAVSTIMSWTGQSGALVDHLPLETRNTLASAGDTPLDPPPDYSHPYVPTGTVTYTFSFVEHDAMLLLPPANALDTRPLYHISVSLNPFLPQYSTTAIRRGGTANATHIGSLEWGSDYSSCLISLGSVRCRRFSAFRTKKNSSTAMEWSWEWPGDLGNKLYWIADRGVAKCYLISHSSWLNVNTDTPIAKFIGRDTINNTAGGPSHSPITLTVTPSGHEGPRLHYIILCVLIFERMRHVDPK